MKVLFFGTVLLSLGFIIHLIIWKIKIPLKQTPILLKIFFGIFIIWTFILLGAPEYARLLGLQINSLSFLEYIHVFIFYTAVTLAYISFYSLIEIDSPSFRIIIELLNAGSNGLDEKDLYHALSSKPILESRISQLIKDGMIIKKNENYIPTMKGIKFLKMIILYRKLMKASQKGG